LRPVICDNETTRRCALLINIFLCLSKKNKSLITLCNI
jgi:hypothetical protein